MMIKKKKKVIIKLQGGLGNQMFQYAAAKGLGFDKIILDLSFLKKHSKSTKDFTAREFELRIFNKININEISKFNYKIIKSKFLNKLFGIKFKKINQINNELVSIDNSLDIIYLDGYFQSEKYFYNYRKSLIQDFEFPKLNINNEKIKKIISNSSNSVSIHIRRGDYLKSPIIQDVHGIVPMEYYKKAIDILLKKHENLNLFLFSDDMNYVKKNFKNYSNLFFVEGNDNKDSWQDMALMNACKHHVIANSSFSWWGAWLSNQEGITIAPRHFFNPKVDYNINDYIPENWIIIEYDFNYV